MSSKRSFDAAKLVNFRNPHHHVIERLREIFFKFSLNIHRLELASSILQEDEVLSLLNILQKVEAITFYDVEFVGSESDKDLQLNHLRKFDFHLCNVKIPNVILKLPLNVLNSLTIENCILKKEKLHEIFENQRNIQELLFDPYYVSPASMNHLKLNKIKLMCNRNVANILRNQPDLASLDLSRAHIGGNEFLEVCNLHKIENLKLWIDRVSSEILGNLSSLTTMTDCTINYDRLEVEYMRNLTRIKIPSIRKLKIKFPRLKILPNNFIELSINMPHLKHLNISNQSVGVLGVLIESFINLETLIIGCDSDSPEVVDFPVGKAQHAKLKELCIYSSFANQKYLKCSQTILEIISKSLVKLEKLKLSNIISLNSQQVQKILADHESFTHLSVNNPKIDDISFDKDFVQIIQDTGKSLKYFQLRGIEIPVHKKVLEKNFRGQFSYVNIKPWRNQIVLRNCKWEHADD